MSDNNIAKAWDLVKGQGDADFGAARGELKADLQERADAIRKDWIDQQGIDGR